MSAAASLVQLQGVSTASELATSATAGEASEFRGGGSAILPAPAELAAVLPWAGLRRGSTVTVHDSPYLLFGLLSEAAAAGSWTALVGLAGISPLAAADMGVDPARMAVVPRPGRDAVDVVAALLDGVDLVVLGATRDVAEQDARRLSARARHRGAVLLPFGEWPGADVELWCGEASWSGPESGHGRLTERRVTVRSQGRGAAARTRSRRVALPARDGTIAAAETPSAPAQLHRLRPVAE